MSAAEEVSVWRALEACSARMDAAVEEALRRASPSHAISAGEQALPTSLAGGPTPMPRGGRRSGQTAPAGRAYGAAYSASAGPGKRARRNVCQGAQPAPAAPTITIEPGQGLPADHQLTTLNA